MLYNKHCILHGAPSNTRLWSTTWPCLIGVITAETVPSYSDFAVKLSSACVLVMLQDWVSYALRSTASASKRSLL